MTTADRLAEALDALGLPKLAARSRLGEFSDFQSVHSFPKLFLVSLLADEKTANPKDKERVRKIEALRKAIKSGEYDDTRQEAEEWYNNEGRKLL